MNSNHFCQIKASLNTEEVQLLSLPESLLDKVLVGIHLITNDIISKSYKNLMDK